MKKTIADRFEEIIHLADVAKENDAFEWENMREIRRITRKIRKAIKRRMRLGAEANEGATIRGKVRKAKAA